MIKLIQLFTRYLIFFFFLYRSEYLLFKKILILDYVYPDGFSPDAKDLVQKLLVLDPNERLGAKDTKRYTSIRSHPFYKGLDFDTLSSTNPPPIYPYLPGNSEGQEELRSHYRVPDHLEPGLDDKQLTRLLGLDGQSSSTTTTPAPMPRPRKRSGILQMNDEEKQQQLNQQRSNSRWNSLVEGNLIVKQGLVDKRKVSFVIYNVPSTIHYILLFFCPGSICQKTYVDVDDGSPFILCRSDNYDSQRRNTLESTITCGT